MTLSTPLIELLYQAPDRVTPLVQDAIRAVAVGDWQLASRWMRYACDACNVSDEWGDLASMAADELHAIGTRSRSSTSPPTSRLNSGFASRSSSAICGTPSASEMRT